MCDLWINKYRNPNPDTIAQFAPVDVTDDGLSDTCTFGKGRFYLIKFPGVDKERVRKYLGVHYGVGAEVEPPILNQRRWAIRHGDLPLAARQKFQTQGYITVKVGTYTGEYDYTWNQVKQYFRDNQLNVDESGNL